MLKVLIAFKAHLTEIAILSENFAKELLKGVLKAKIGFKAKTENWSF